MLLDTLIGILAAQLTLAPLAWKWKLGLVRAIAAVAALGSASGALVWGIGLDLLPAPLTAWLVTVTAALALVASRFYRDPQRTPPARDDAIVSPADGRVVYVYESKNGHLPVSAKNGRPYALDELLRTPLQHHEAIVIGISMNLLDVHVNRAPLAGRVAIQRHHKGAFKSLRRLESIFENERNTVVIERDGMGIAVVQIASRLVRRIVSFIGEGQRVRCGDRIGVIRFGSQVDLVIPLGIGLRVLARPGQRVTAGESILAVIEATPSGEDTPAENGVGQSFSRR
jgi:phosphatidylserine decarboxylase